MSAVAKTVRRGADDLELLGMARRRSCLTIKSCCSDVVQTGAEEAGSRWRKTRWYCSAHQTWYLAVVTFRGAGAFIRKILWAAIATSLEQPSDVKTELEMPWIQEVHLN
jgi:hypothetical protein